MKRIKPGASFEATVDSPTSGLVGTIEVSIEDGLGSVVTAATTSGIVESPAGSGIYTATLTAPSTGGFYVVVWNDGTGTPAGYAAETIEVTSTAVSPGTLSIRDHIETGLSDDALTELVAQATAEVEDRFGTDAAMSVIKAGDWGTVIRLPRAISSITSIVEKDSSFTTLSTLVAADYVVGHSGRVIYRVGQCWAPVVVITYTPVSEQTKREAMIIDLVKLAVNYSGLKSEKIGDYSYDRGDTDYETARQRILGRNRSGFLRFA